MNTQNTEKATDLASHAPAAAELITGLLKRHPHLSPEQKESTCWSSTLLQGAGDIWLRPLRVSTPADVSRSTGFLDFSGQEVGPGQGEPRHHGSLVGMPFCPGGAHLLYRLISAAAIAGQQSGQS